MLHRGAKKNLAARSTKILIGIGKKLNGFFRKTAVFSHTADGELVKIPVSVHKPDEAVRIAAVSAEDYGCESKAKIAHARVADRLRAAIRVKAAVRTGCNEAVEEPVHKRMATAEISTRFESVSAEQQHGQAIRLTDQVSIPPREPVMIQMKAPGADEGLHKWTPAKHEKATDECAT